MTASPITQEPGPGARQRQRTLVVNGAVLAAIVITVVVSSVVQHSRGAAVYPPPYNGPYAPVTLNADSTVTMAQPGVTRPVVDVYEDFQCPICGEFELANGGTLQQLAYQGRVKVIYHPFTIFLGTPPAQANSTRAWAAAKCVSAAFWLRYHNLLYAGQPAETTVGGFPLSLLVALGRQIGLTSPAFSRCVVSQRYAPQVVGVSQAILQGGVNATPTVRLNGHPVGLDVLVEPSITLRQMILSAR